MSATTAASNSSTRNKHSTASATPPSNYSAPPIDITKEEFSRISDCLKNEEFRKLFLDYCEEIQDPENRARYESEIIQLEAERGVEVKFVNPEPGFVIKTAVDGALKCFVNVAKSVEVAKPTSEACLNHETGMRGLNWSIPLAQAPPRDDVDAHGKRCRVYDVVFHPDALYLAQRNQAFHKCLIDTALDAVEREYKVSLDRANLKFPKLQFKGIARPTVIRNLAKNAEPETAEPHPLDHIYPAKPGPDAGQPKVLPMKTKPMAKSPEFTTPKYVIKHRRDVDLAEYTDELDAKLSVTRPHELIVEIELPLLHSSAECQLDVTARTLYLISERAGAKYRLSLELPYTVDDKRGVARFDTDLRRLCITLPVLPPSGAAAEKERSMRDTLLLHLNREDSGVESDMRDELNSNSGESPVEDEEELSDSLEENTATDQANDEASPTPTPPLLLATSTPTIVTAAAASPQTPTKSFLKNSIHYQFPAKFDCNVLDNVMSLVLHVRNVQPNSIATLLQQPHAKQLHLQFTSIGAGYYPTHYAFCLQLPSESDIRIASFEAEAWENNVVLNLNLATTSENLHSYLAGLDSNDLKMYAVQEKFQVAHNSRQRKKSPPLTTTLSSPVVALIPPFSSSLDISVERSDCERSVEIEIKPRGEEHHSTAAAATTTEDERPAFEQAAQTQQKKQLNKKQKKNKNKKRRSLSESACDDFNKAFQQQQQQHQQQQQNQQEQKQLQQINKKNVAANDDDDDDDCYNSSPERDEDSTQLTPKAKSKHTTSSSVAVPTSTPKQRSYSECRQQDSISSSVTLPSSFKGILKHCSRYAPPQCPSISDSCSSIDDYSVGSSSYSCSIDAGLASSLHRFASHSFSDIPEERAEEAGLSESCKKTVRFNEVIMKQVFRLDSSILGQRKKNQKRRDRKQRALQRRLSEGDSADYEDNKPVVLQATAAQYFKSKDNHQNNMSKSANSGGKKPTHDSGLDLSSGNSRNESKGSKLNNNNTNGSSIKVRARFESESSSDVDATKNSMMFEMDM